MLPFIGCLSAEVTVSFEHLLSLLFLACSHKLAEKTKQNRAIEVGHLVTRNYALFSFFFSIFSSPCYFSCNSFGIYILFLVLVSLSLSLSLLFLSFQSVAFGNTYAAHQASLYTTQNIYTSYLHNAA